MVDEYKPRDCGPTDGVEADAEGASVKEAVQAAYRRAADICQLFGGCDKLNPICLFQLAQIKISSNGKGMLKATVRGACRCGQHESVPGELF
jgi:hypothetical protein